MSDVQKLTIQTRRPRDGKDPGAVEIGYWFVSGDAVWLSDENGVRTGDKQTLVSGRLTRKLCRDKPAERQSRQAKV